MVVFQICNEMVETVRLCGPGIIAERRLSLAIVVDTAEILNKENQNLTT